MFRIARAMFVCGCAIALSACLPAGGGGGGGSKKDGGVGGQGGSGGSGGFSFGGSGGGGGEGGRIVDAGAGGEGGGAGGEGGGAGGEGGGAGGEGGGGPGGEGGGGPGGEGGEGGEGGGMMADCDEACDLLAGCAQESNLCPGVSGPADFALVSGSCLPLCEQSPVVANLITQLQGSCDTMVQSVMEASPDFAEACEDSPSNEELCREGCDYFGDCVDPNCEGPLINREGCFESCMENPADFVNLQETACGELLDTMCAQRGVADFCDCGLEPFNSNVGAACSDPSDCDVDGLQAQCIMDAAWPGGYCTALSCNANIECGDDAVCLLIDEATDQTACFDICDNDCRAGYVCEDIGVNQSLFVCVPPQQP